MSNTRQLLYDFDVESCPLVLAQTAILLTFHPGNQQSWPTQSNTSWLSKAIQHCKAIKAHQAARAQEIGSRPSSKSEKHRILMRRIWWCCITRDRMLSLGLHRELQIPDTFPTLVLCDDFKYDVGRSPVRCANSQRQMHEMFLAISRLCNTVTGLLQTTPSVAGSEQHITDLSRCENELNAWFEFTSRRFPDLANSRKPPEHWFVIQRSFMYTYYL